MATIAPCFWFDANALEATEFYVELLPESSIDRVMPGPAGDPLLVEFTLMGRPFQALNGGPTFVLSEAELVGILADPDPERAARAHDALMQMRKIDPAALRAAADGAA